VSRYGEYRFGAMNAADLANGGDPATYPSWIQFTYGGGAPTFTGLTVTKLLQG
jgi:hypothetical protein